MAFDLYLIVILFFISLSVFFGIEYYSKDYKTHLRFGAGHSNSESYSIAEAINQLCQEENLDFTIEVIETDGSKQNVTKLENGELDLALNQADIDGKKVSRLIANLYPDACQLIVRNDSGIESFEELKGKIVGVPNEKSGQSHTLKALDDHYGMFDKYKAMPFTDEKAADAILSGEIDAIFRVRSPINTNIKKILSTGLCKIVPLHQVEAIALQNPSMEVGIIPAGSYVGDPAIPAEDLKTIFINRQLIATSKVKEEYVEKLTELLFTRKKDMINYLGESPLPSFIHKPVKSEGTLIPIHKGALNYYDKDIPKWYIRKADFFGFLLSLILAIISALAALKTFITDQQKNLADDFTIELGKKTNLYYKNVDINYREEEIYLYEMLEAVISKLDKDEMNEEGFIFFSFMWKVVLETLEKGEKGD